MFFPDQDNGKSVGGVTNETTELYKLLRDPRDLLTKRLSVHIALSCMYKMHTRASHPNTAASNTRQTNI